MSAERKCAEIRDLLPELALGIAGGEERAGALQHLAHCVDCRRELEQLSEVADELMLIAPEKEPPIGFESRVLEQVGARPKSRRRGLALAAAAAVILAAVAAGAVYQAGSHDRVLAAQYERVLARFDGEYFQTGALEGSPSGAKGQVFGYQGSPSWLFVLVPGQSEEASYDITLETRHGRQIPLGTVDVTASGGSWGKAIPVDLGEIARLRLDDANGHALEARFAHWEGD
jgi:putative zinc finger protein